MIVSFTELHKFLNSSASVVIFLAATFFVCQLVCTSHTTLQKHNNEYSNKILPEKGLRGHSNPNFYIHVSVSDLYIPTIGRPILLQENRWTDPGNV
jgi:hypothetical protein